MNRGQGEAVAVRDGEMRNNRVCGLTRIAGWRSVIGWMVALTLALLGLGCNRAKTPLWNQAPAPQPAVSAPRAAESAGELPASSTNAGEQAAKAVTAATAPNRQDEHLPLGEIRTGKAGAKRLALTLDVGPWAEVGVAEAILEVLKKGEVQATFFFSGKFVEKQPGFVAKAADSGHYLANHTYSHPDLTKVSREEIISELENTQSLLEKAAGKEIRPLFFRPPYGASSAKVLEAAQSVGFRSVMWTVEALDWQKGATVEKVVARVMERTRDGAIILMHIDKVTIESLPTILERLKGEGYRFVGLEEIVQGPERLKAQD